MAPTIRIHEGYARPIHETVIDGVQTFWADCDGPFSAKLLFRVGRADETLLTSGITHLVEHLALPQYDRHATDDNGTTKPLVTTFEGTGDKREVLGFLAEVAQSLSRLPVGRLEHERRVLREEGASFAASVSSSLERIRFGARYFGLYDQPEYGIYRLSASQVSRWARRHFTAGNAVLWMTARPPRHFTLRLPPGTRRPPPQPPATTILLPAWSAGAYGQIGWSALATPSIADRFAAEILRSRLHRMLRRELGIAYHAWLEWHVLGGGLVHAIVGAGVLDGYEQVAAEEVVRVIDELAADGPDADELRWHKRDAIHRARPVRELPNWLDRLALAEILGEQDPSTAAWIAEVATLTPRHIAGALSDMLDAAILRTDEVDLPDRRYSPIPVWSGDVAVAGRRYNEAAREDGSADQLVVGDLGVSYVDEDGVGTISFAQAAALIRRDGIPSDLHRLDGERIVLEGILEWPRGKAALRAVAEVTPPRLVVDVL